MDYPGDVINSAFFTSLSVASRRVGFDVPFEEISLAKVALGDESYEFEQQFETAMHYLRYALVLAEPFRSSTNLWNKFLKLPAEERIRYHEELTFWRSFRFHVVASAKIAISTSMTRLIETGRIEFVRRKLPSPSVLDSERDVHEQRSILPFEEVNKMLNQKAMLISLTITKWGTRKLDSQATSKVAEIYQADEKKAGSYSKALIDRNNPTLKMLNALAGEIRNYVYSRTMPWSEEGQRILPVGVMFEMQTKLEDYARDWERVVDEFCTKEYPNLVSAARIHLGAMYNTQDYPSPSQIRAKFSMSVSFAPLPAGEDFRVAISEEERKRIATEIEQNTRATCAKANEDLNRRVITAVKHMATSLSEYSVEVDEDGKQRIKNPFRDSLVENVREIADLIPKMNFTDDPVLANVVKEIKDKLTVHDPKALRASPMLREQTAQEAKNILNKLNVL